VNTFYVVNFAHLDALVVRVYDWAPLNHFQTEVKERT